MYQFWSKNRNIHFGYYRWGMNPFRLEPMLVAMNDFVAAQLGLELDAGYRILDLGCGYGATIQHLLSHHPNLDLVGIGKDVEQIKAAAAGSQGSFMVADFEAIPLSEGSFDAVYGLESFCFAKGHSKLGVVKEAARLLRQDGRLLVVDGFIKQSRTLPFPIRYLYEKSTVAWGMDSLPILPDFIQMLERQGFASIETRDLSWRIAPSLLHIPFVSFRLWLTFLRSKDTKLLVYAKALLFTLLLSPFKAYFCYCIVTCRKTTVRLKN